MMLSLYSAKAIALQIRFRRIRMERAAGRRMLRPIFL